MSEYQRRFRAHRSYWTTVANILSVRSRQALRFVTHTFTLGLGKVYFVLLRGFHFEFCVGGCSSFPLRTFSLLVLYIRETGPTIMIRVWSNTSDDP